MVWLLWLGFLVFIISMLAIDLGVLHRGAQEVSPKRAFTWTALCIFLALAFGVGVYFLYENHIFDLGLDPRYPNSGRSAALQYITGWLIEQTLSLDNVFVIAVIFGYFKIPVQYQHRVLFWGILGALIMRGIVIALGTVAIEEISWANYIFGAMLIYAGIKILIMDENDFDPKKSLAYRGAVKFYPVSQELDGERFFTKLNGKRAITPLFLVLLLIESTDVLFAIDSIPAVFAVTRDPFLVFTSNIFAILNLRSLYFALALMVGKFHHLKTSLLFVLVFVGLKMMLHYYIHIPTEISFLVIVCFIALGVVASMVLPTKKEA